MRRAAQLRAWHGGLGRVGQGQARWAGVAALPQSAAEACGAPGRVVGGRAPRAHRGGACGRTAAPRGGRRHPKPSPHKRERFKTVPDREVRPSPAIETLRKVRPSGMDRALWKGGATSEAGACGNSCHPRSALPSRRCTNWCTRQSSISIRATGTTWSAARKRKRRCGATAGRWMRSPSGPACCGTCPRWTPPRPSWGASCACR